LDPETLNVLIVLCWLGAPILSAICIPLLASQQPRGRRRR
jgi:hypothetical protein